MDYLYIYIDSHIWIITIGKSVDHWKCKLGLSVVGALLSLAVNLVAWASIEVQEGFGRTCSYPILWKDTVHPFCVGLLLHRHPLLLELSESAIRLLSISLFKHLLAVSVPDDNMKNACKCFKDTYFSFTTCPSPELVHLQ